MPQELTTYTGSGYTADRMLALANGEAKRQPIWFDSWTTIRIGLQFTMDRNGSTSTVSGTPLLAFGLCSGTDNVLLTGTADHVVGVRNVNPSWTYTAGPPIYYASGSNSAYRGFKKVGATYTDASAAFSNNLLAWPTAAYFRNTMIVEITKGSPNYSMVFWANNATGAQADVGDTAFEEAMSLASFSGISSVSGIGSGTIDTTPKTIAVDEGADGALNHLFVFWERTTQKFAFNIRHRKVA